jgi:hypothetical protein
LSVDSREVGGGYGHPTLDGAAAAETARREMDLGLDPTYTAKAFSAVLKLVLNATRAAPTRVQNVLYWHTLSAAPVPERPGDVPLPEQDAGVVKRLLGSRWQAIRH